MPFYLKSVAILHGMCVMLVADPMMVTRATASIMIWGFIFFAWKRVICEQANVKVKEMSTT
jgi:hypothetical protein